MGASSLHQVWLRSPALRAVVDILAKRALKASACECYEAVKRNNDRLAPKT